MNECNIVYIKLEFFQNNSNLKEVLDSGNIQKQTRRGYLFLNIKYNRNNILIPLRTNLNMKGTLKIGFKLPTQSKPDAGLDYRKLLIVDSKYIVKPNVVKIPNSQKEKIIRNYDNIVNEVIKYIKGYIKQYEKGRIDRDRLYIFSTLKNFHKELGIKPKDIDKAETKESIKDKLKLIRESKINDNKNNNKKLEKEFTR